MNLPIKAALLAVCSFTVYGEACKDMFTAFRADVQRPYPGERPPTATQEGIDCQSRGAVQDPQPAGPVSFYKLSHKVPSKARKEFIAALKLEAENKTQEGIEHLRKAIAIDPAYMEAYNNLGSRLLAVGQATEAMAALRQAVQIDPTSSYVHSNLGVVYLAVHNFPEAEREGKVAIALDPMSAKSRYVVGMALLVQGKDKEAARHHLKLAALEMPGVVKILERIK